MNDGMRTRAIRVLILLSVLTTLLAWYDSDGQSVIGITDSDGLLAALAATIGLFLHVANIRFAWIGIGFAAVAMWGVTLDSSLESRTAAPLAGAILATVVTVMMMIRIVSDIRSAPLAESDDA